MTVFDVGADSGNWKSAICIAQYHSRPSAGEEYILTP